MELREYEEFVRSRCRAFVDFPYTVVALNEEAGEVAGWYKKAVLRRDDKYTDKMLLEEMGDVLFYLIRMGQLRGYDVKAIFDANVAKLEKRGERIG